MSPLVALRQFALSLPGAWEDFPWGESVIKVDKKVFLFRGREGDSVQSFGVKLPQSAAVWIERGFAKPTGYGLGRYGWASFELKEGIKLSTAELEGLVLESHTAVAPKRLRTSR